jgi:hypothetical protein
MANVNGIMQLSAYGAQDVYLTGNPPITFFKVTYRQHTNFALDNYQHIAPIHHIILIKFRISVRKFMYHEYLTPEFDKTFN